MYQYEYCFYYKFIEFKYIQEYFNYTMVVYIMVEGNQADTRETICLLLEGLVAY